MISTAPLVLGTLLVLIGGILVLLVLVLMRVTPQVPPAGLPVPTPALETGLPRPEDAVLFVRPGGQVVFLNEQARNWFGVQEEANLERMARLTRPAEHFLSLCATPGRAQIAVGTRLVEARSYRGRWDGQAVTVVVLHPPEVPVLGQDQEPFSGRALTILAELAQSMTTSLDLEDTLKAVMDSVEKLIPCDFFEITLWDEAGQVLVPYRYVGALGQARTLRQATERYTAEDGYSGYLIRTRRPLLISDVDARRDVRPKLSREEYPFRSYLGVPLLLEDQLIGTLELGSLDPAAFTERDQLLLGILARQAAVAIRNAQVHRQQARRVKEMSGLARLTQAATTLRNPEDLYTHLMEGVAPLFNADVVGFWLYDETQGMLVAQSPFQGVPEHVLPLFRVPIEPGSRAEALWRKEDVLFTSDASQDERLQILGLAPLAQAAGIHQAVLARMSAAGEPVGYLMVANPRDGVLGAEEQRLATIIAGQVGPIIENARLLRQSQQRTRRSEVLRRIASLVASSATLDEILQFSLLELVRLSGAQIGLVLLYVPERGTFDIHAPSLYGLRPTDFPTGLQIPIDDRQFDLTVTATRRPFLTNQAGTDRRILPAFRPLVQHLGLQSVLSVPLVSRDVGVGEVVLASRQADRFSLDELQLAGTAASLLASAIERERLFAQTDQSLHRRVEQLATLARLSRELSATLDLDTALERVFRQAVALTNADCGAILLVDQEHPEVVQHIWGEERETRLHPLEAEALQQGQPQVIQRLVGPEYTPPHPGVRSALIMPVRFRQQPLGVLHLHSGHYDHFGTEEVEIVQVLAAQVGTAIYSALQYQQVLRLSQKLQRRADTLTQLLFTARGLTADTSLTGLMERIIQAVREATPFDVVLGSLYDPQSGQLQRVAAVGLPEDVWQAMQQRPQPWAQLQALLQPQFEYQGVYFIPYEQRPVLPPEVHLVTVLPGEGVENNVHWHPEDLLLVPLYSTQGEPLGLISVDAPRDGLRPDQTTLESLRLLADQAVLLLESRQAMQQQAEQVARLEAQLQQIEAARAQQQEQLATLQAEHRQQEETLARLQNLAPRVQAVLQLARRLHRQTDPQQMLQLLAQQLSEIADCEHVLLVEPTPEGPRLVQALGPAAGQPLEALLGQRNPVLAVLQEEAPLLVSDVHASAWADSPLLNRLQARAFLCLPIGPPVRPAVEAVVLATHAAPHPFDAVEAELYRLLSTQAAMALEKLSLTAVTDRRLREVNLLLDFTRRINRLDPNAILQTLLESAYQVITGAQTAFVALWDTGRQALVPQVAHGVPDMQALTRITLPMDSLPGRVFRQGEALRVAEVDFSRDYPLSSADLVHYQQAMGGQLPLSSLLVPLRVAGEMQGVVVFDSLRDVNAFSENDQALLESLVDQSSLMLEKVRLLHASEQRALQLEALTDAAGALTASLELDTLQQRLLEVLVPVLPFDTATLWIREGQRFTIRASWGFTPQDDPTGLSVAVEDSRILQDMLANAQRPLYVPDVRQDARFPAAEAREMRSWLGIPLLGQEGLAGVIALEKREPGAYSPDLLQLAATFGSQASIALENARLFAESRQRATELDQRSRRLALLHRLSLALIGSLDVSHILRTACEELRQALTADHVSAILFDPDLEHPRVLWEAPPVHQELPIALPPAPFFQHLQERRGALQVAAVATEEELQPLQPFLQALDTHSLLALPLVTHEELHGLLLVHHRTDRHHAAAELELGITIANQTAVSVRSARLYQETRHLSAELEQRVAERTAELAHEHQRTETLLRLITEASASLDLDHVLDRTLAVLNEATGAEQSNIMLQRPGEDTLYYRAAYGLSESAPHGGRPTAIKANRSLAGWVITNQQALLIEDLHRDPRWVNAGGIQSRHRRSAIAVPLTLGAETLGALLLFHSQPGYFSPHQVELVQAAANQIAVVINNAELFALIRDQSEHLGALMRDFQVEASRSHAILEAVADGVLVTDAKGRITLFNESAERILGLKREKVLEHSLDNFLGLFGNAAREWMETIRRWSEEPESYRPGDVYAAQITLDDGRVVAVHLSPVYHRRDFLGTVSIFRDITHQVELDRMKSEFVANVSHELRTPMTSIKGYVDILLMGAAGPLSEQQRQFLEVVKNNTERLNVLVQDLLDISRYESGQIRLTRQPLSLPTLAEEVLREIEQLADKEQRPMHFQLEAEPDLPSVLGDRERIHQVLYNLLDNAYHYTPEGGRINVRIRRRGEEIQVDVSDTGVGIPPDEQAQVFERFYRGENPLVMATPGTGLGLSITRYLVEMHGGRIWVTSEGIPGRGSTFSFTLPLQPPAQEEEE